MMMNEKTVAFTLSTPSPATSSTSPSVAPLDERKTKPRSQSLCVFCQPQARLLRQSHCNHDNERTAFFFWGKAYMCNEKQLLVNKSLLNPKFQGNPVAGSSQQDICLDRHEEQEMLSPFRMDSSLVRSECLVSDACFLPQRNESNERVSRWASCRPSISSVSSPRLPVFHLSL